MRKIWCLSLLSLLCMASVYGQKFADGRGEIRDIDVVRGENSLFVSMTVDVSALDVASNRELLLVPMLKGEQDSVQLPFVIVAGRNRYYYHCVILLLWTKLFWNVQVRRGLLIIVR